MNNIRIPTVSAEPPTAATEIPAIWDLDNLGVGAGVAVIEVACAV
jgi:hypothetical protein